MAGEIWSGKCGFPKLSSPWSSKFQLLDWRVHFKGLQNFLHNCTNEESKLLFEILFSDKIVISSLRGYYTVFPNWCQNVVCLRKTNTNSFILSQAYINISPNYYFPRKSLSKYLMDTIDFNQMKNQNFYLKSCFQTRSSSAVWGDIIQGWKLALTQSPMASKKSHGRELC
jgi:hypothetical protein